MYSNHAEREAAWLFNHYDDKQMVAFIPRLLGDCARGVVTIIMIFFVFVANTELYDKSSVQ